MLQSLIRKTMLRLNSRKTIGISRTALAKVPKNCCQRSTVQWTEWNQSYLSVTARNFSGHSFLLRESDEHRNDSFIQESGNSSTPMRQRSFLLDSPTKPTRKRESAERTLPLDASGFERRVASNPYASVLASPVRQCLYTRKLLPNAFMTKLIQAAPEARGDRAWIVPEKIIPYRLIKGSTSKHDSSRFGIGKWVHSGTQTLERMTKEGKYKMINPSAYMRPDIARLVYAQWTIRVAYDLTELGRQKNKHFNIISKPKELAIRDSNVEGGITDFDYKRLPRLQCVLFFGSSGTSSDSKYDDETTNSDLKPTENSDPLISVDITRAGLPMLMNRSLVLSQAMIHCQNGTSYEVPQYDMDHLFSNHPEGLAAIRKYLSVGSISRLNSAEHPSIQYIGLVESQKTLNATMNLWKLASILPKL